MAAEEHHGRWATLQQRRQCDQLPVLVRQHERRHRLARSRRVFAAAILVQSYHQAINRRTIGGKDLAAGVGIGTKLLVQRALHIAAALESEP